MLEKALELGAISYIDFALARFLGALGTRDDEDAELFLAHIALCSRLGHLCVEVGEKNMYPDPKIVWFERQQLKVDGDILAAIYRGAGKVSPSILRTVDLENLSSLNRPLCRWGKYYYFQKNYLLESIFLRDLRRIIAAKPDIDLDARVVHKHLNAKQREAIKHICRHSFTILLGGPGTGKTYTIGAFIEAVKHALGDRVKIVAAAPTGKAAIRLQNALGNQIKAGTLHAIVGGSAAFLFDESKDKIDADLIVIDECSMLDIKMAANFLRGVKSGSRLVLIGDPDQLSPVEAGSMFKDITESLIDRRVTLDCVERTKENRIIEAARLLREGREEELCNVLNLQDIGEQFMEQIFSLMPLDFRDNPASLLHEYDKCRIFAPFRRGSFGVREINARFLETLFQRSRRGEVFAVPIMIAKNDYRLNLFNGDTGVLLLRKGYSLDVSEPIAAYFHDPEESGKTVRFIPTLLPEYEPAFCVSIHKSQGSEYERVFVVLPPGSEIFGREALYTALTRAKKSFCVASSEITIQKMVRCQNRRLSTIPFRLLAITA